MKRHPLSLPAQVLAAAAVAVALWMPAAARAGDEAARSGRPPPAEAGAPAPHKRIDEAIDDAVRGIERGLRAAERGVRIGAAAAARGIERGAEATARAAERIARRLERSRPPAPPPGSERTGGPGDAGNAGRHTQSLPYGKAAGTDAA